MKKIFWMVILLLCVSSVFADRPSHGGFIPFEVGDYSYQSTSQNEKVVTLISNPSHYNKITISKWDNDTYFDIFMPDSTDGNIYFDNGFLTINYNLFQGVIYMQDNDTMEWEGVFSRKPNPSQGVIVLQVNVSGMTPYYQPPLDYNGSENCNATSCWDVDGNITDYRPEIVVGSYAFYVDESNNDFKTGKVFHLYRPYLIDANNLTAWVDVNITGDVMTFTLPIDWMRTVATYPVVLDPTFGYTGIGGSELYAGANTVCGFFSTGVAELGDVTSVSWYHSDQWNNEQLDMGYYDDDGSQKAPRNVINKSGLGASTGASGTWQWYNQEVTGSLSALTDYWICGYGSVRGDCAYDDSVSGANTVRNASNDFPDPWGGNTAAYSGRRISIYLNYTASANSVPTHDNPHFLLSNHNDSVNVTCINQSTSDADDDTVFNVFNWLLNGTGYGVVNMPFEIANTTGSEDYSGNNYDGVLMNGTTWVSSGKVGGGVSFAGDSGDGDDYVNLSTINEMNNLSSKSFTAMLWMELDSLASSEGRAEIALQQMDGTGTGRTFIRVHNTGDNIESAIGGSTFEFRSNIDDANRWYHVAVVYNGSHVLGFVNGSLTNFSSASMENADGFFLLGINKALNGAQFEGTIDQLKMFNRSLTSEQIKSIYLNEADNYSSGSTIVSQETVNGDNWTCEVTPTDLIGDGITKSNSTLIQDVVAGADDSCDYCTGSQNCNISCSDTCRINSTINMPDYNLTLTGTGSIVFNADLLVDNIFLSKNCEVMLNKSNSIINKK